MRQLHVSSRTTPLTLAAILLAAVMATLYAQTSGGHSKLPSHIRGIVVDQSGNPVAGALLYYVADEGAPPKTDAQGRFDVVSAAPVILVQKEGYKHAYARVSPAAENEIRMAAAGDRPKLPVCANLDESIGLHYGLSGLRFKRIKGVKATRQKLDTDYWARSYYVSGRKTDGAVWHGSGPLWGGSPSEELIWKSVELEEKAYDAGGIVVTDTRGLLPNGTRWRVIAGLCESASYEHLDASIAALFDRLLDGACYDPEHRLYK